MDAATSEYTTTDPPTGTAPAVWAASLTRLYDGVAVVDAIDLEVRRGECFALLGPNGAGKTTTLRMLLGLVRPTAGSARVLDALPGAPEGLARLGTLVEEPAFYPYLSGHDNLRVLARYADADEGRISDVLDIVALTPRAKSKVKTYSLGMRQRLGVAAALLKDPDLLILDEPTNGLDPKGMAEMRRLIRDLGTDHRAVVLSSHLLGEVEQTCDRVAVINRGKLVADGEVAELRGAGSLLVTAEPLDRAREVALRVPGVEDAQVLDGRLRVSTDPGQAGALNAALVGAGVQVRELRAVQQSLEDVFLALTGEETSI